MADNTPAAPAAASATRPEKPDEAAFNQEHAKLEKELADIKNKSVCCFSLDTRTPHRHVPHNSKAIATNKPNYSKPSRRSLSSPSMERIPVAQNSSKSSRRSARSRARANPREMPSKIS